MRAVGRQSFAVMPAVASLAALSGCVSSPRIDRVEAAPLGCELLGTIYIDQMGNQPAGREAFDDLAHQAEKLGGNTLQCCEMDAEETTLFARNPRTGETYTGAHRHHASVYRCPKTPSE